MSEGVATNGKSTTPHSDFLYEIANDSNYPHVGISFGDFLLNTNPDVYDMVPFNSGNDSNFLYREYAADEHTCVPETYFGLIVTSINTFLKCETDPIYKANVNQYNNDVRVGRADAAGYVLQPNGERTKKLDRVPDWESAWNFTDAKLLFKHLSALGVVNNIEDTEDREYKENMNERGDVHEPYKRQKIKKQKGKPTTIRGTVLLTVCVCVTPHENDEYLDAEKTEKKKNTNIYASGANDLNVNRVFEGGFLSLYIIQHERGYPYAEWYCENYEGRLAKETGDPKFQNYFPIGHVFECNEENVGYSLLDTIQGKMGLKSLSVDGSEIVKINKNLHWEDIYTDYYKNKSYKINILRPTNTYYK